ncbi:MAG: PTS glucose transporter subunit IIA [Oscillospiraceae bacterium]|nr:PTS glucose transporter subunit IIA [Oscillospiraceae bacterium]MCL2279796.1 PTS glucose transporter subunit IIA [Oscillospiraceae bacterium]
MLFGKKKRTVILSPADGKLLPITQVSDPTFSEEMLGKGVAICPSEGKIFAPVSGKIEQVFDTSHAISLISDDGAEILIHVGLNTVELKGKFFKTHCADGDTVTPGDLLLEFDLQDIADAGYDTVTPVVICNSDEFEGFAVVTEREISKGEEILSIKKLQR